MLTAGQHDLPADAESEQDRFRLRYGSHRRLEAAESSIGIARGSNASAESKRGTALRARPCAAVELGLHAAFGIGPQNARDGPRRPREKHGEHHVPAGQRPSGGGKPTAPQNPEKARRRSTARRAMSVDASATRRPAHPHPSRRGPSHARRSP
jgi:hypothetical protein